MASPIIATVPLGPQWPTLDPFLFCAHHLDHYPAGDGRHGPAASLDGRDLGQDFAGVDGWRMYHGRTVPGFPQHPHRGFETITFVRRGLIDHSDSLGAAARFGRGDVQWVTAGGGIVHSEMFPLLDEHGPNTLELFQIWLNLPAADKLVDPYFTMVWDSDIPRVVVGDEGSAVEITVIAGRLGDATPQSPPPNSWAARAEADVALWHLRFDPGAEWELPPAASAETGRVLYVFEGGELRVADQSVASGTGVQLEGDAAVTLRAGDEPVEAMLLQGRPIGEPVARYGPFVMNTQAEIQQAFDDYRRTEFGGWPWPDDDPVHGDDPARFARHADGTVERAEADAPAG